MDDVDYFVEVGGALKNKLGITDPDKLAKAEYDLVAEQIGQILSSEPPQKPDFDYLLSLHRQLFQDIYDFAGKVRTVNISKPDSPVPFCYADFIFSESQRIFSQLTTDNYFVGLSKDKFIEKLAWLSSELNALHPFREGNGRTIRLFITQLARNAGYLIDFLIAPHDSIIAADRAAFAGNLAPLIELYNKIVQPISEL